MKGKILITGGAGFLGRGILRRAKRENWPAEIFVYSRDELKQSLCRRAYPDARYILGDVRDVNILTPLMAGMDTVIHAAALKYVPEGEWNVTECISSNVGGTQAVIHCARQSNVQNVVVVSTDKAVKAANVYGMTKALGERLVGESAHFGGPRIVGVRYGNVVGSTGSVVPEFINQAANTGTVHVTDETMTRFWLGIEDAVDLVTLALEDTDVRAGSFLIPVPKSMFLGDLVRALVPKATLVETGLRPGEKKHEVLLTTDESRWTNQLDYAMYELMALKYRAAPTTVFPPFELNSFTAMRMEPEEFMTLVEDSFHV